MFHLEEIPPHLSVITVHGSNIFDGGAEVAVTDVVWPPTTGPTAHGVSTQGTLASDPDRDTVV